MSRRIFDVELLPAPPMLELPPIEDNEDESTPEGFNSSGSFGSASGSSDAKSSGSWRTPTSSGRLSRKAPPPLPPKELAPELPGLPVAPSASIATNSEEENDLSNSETFAPAEWAEIEEWQRKRDVYSSRVNEVLKQKSEEFDAMFDSFYDHLRDAIKELRVPMDVQLDILRVERERIDATKAKLFGATSVDVIEQKIRDKKAVVRDVMRVVKSQAVIRGYLQRRKFNQIWRPLKRRNRVVMEIIDTEVSYVKHLETCLDLYYQPLAQRAKADDPLIPPSDLSLIFGNLLVILNINREFLKDLERQMEQWRWTTTTLGDVFIRFAPFLKSYTTFVNNYEMIQQTLQTQKDRNSEFSNFLKNQSRDPKSRGQDLFSYLYELLLKELIKNTPTEHPDHVLLDQALTDVHGIAMTINDQKRLNENMMKMMQIQNVMGNKCPDLIQPHRRLVKEGSLSLVQRGGAELVQCYVFLFNDSLLLTQVNTGFVNISSNMIFRHFQTLQNCRVEALPPSDGIPHGFEIFFPQVVMQLSASDETKCAEWINLIKDSIQFFTMSSSSRLSARLSMRADSVSSLFSGADSTRSAPGSPSPTSTAEPSKASPAAAVPVQEVPKKSSKQINLEELYDEAIALASALQKLPRELQAVVIDQSRSQGPQEANLLLKMLNPSYISQMKETSGSLRSADLSSLFHKVSTDPTFDVLSYTKEGKQLVTEMKNFVVANFPGGTNDPRNETPRQLVVKLMKWFMSFEQRLASTK